MFAIICRRRLRVSSKHSISISPAPVAVFINSFSFSTKKSSSDVVVNGDASKQSLTVSYLVNSCGFSSKDALSISNKIAIKSSGNPDSVLELLREYGFTNANIHKLITKWPSVLSASPKQTLMPKLEFFRSIGVPFDVLAHNISSYPVILHRSVQNCLNPSYEFLKTLLQSDKRVVDVFKRAPRAFVWDRDIISSVSILRERGIPESFIIALMTHHPSIFLNGKAKLCSYIDRAVEKGFDRSKFVFIHAIQVFAEMTESTLKNKMEIYKRCGWSASDIALAFLKFPLCMKLSEKKIVYTMEFLVKEFGLQPDDVARLPVLLGFNVDRRMKPRYLVARVLKEMGLLKRKINVHMFYISEETFMKRYILNYEEQVPELLDVYRGKLIFSELGFIKK